MGVSPADIAEYDKYKQFCENQVSPFGVYKLVVNGDTVGIHSILPAKNGQSIVAFVITNIYPRYQGKGFGTLLRKLAAERVEGNIGYPVTFWSEANQCNQVSDLPLSYIYSNNEWLWGRNGATTWSSYKAGYGIVSINSTGLVQMLYPRREWMWNEERTKTLMAASRVLQKDRSSKEVIPLFTKIINDLDLKQNAEMSTLRSLLFYIQANLNMHSESTLAIDEFIKGLSQEHLVGFVNYLKGESITQHEQNIPMDMFQFCEAYFDQEKLEFLQETCKRVDRLDINFSLG